MTKKEQKNKVDQDAIEEARKELEAEEAKLKGGEEKKPEEESPKEDTTPPAEIPATLSQPTKEESSLAEQKPKPTKPANSEGFTLNNKEFNDRQFLELLKSHLKITVSYEDTESLLKLGFPRQGFVKSSEYKGDNPDKEYAIYNKAFNDRQFLELLRSTQKIKVSNHERDRLLSLGYPPEGFQAA